MSSDRNAKNFLGIKFVYYCLIISLTLASLVTTKLGAAWLMGADQDWPRIVGGWGLAVGIQLLILFGSLVVAHVIQSAAERRWWRICVLGSIATGVALLGVAMSAVTSYMNYHQVVNDAHLQAVADTAVEWLERGYRDTYHHFVHDSLSNVTLSLDQAYKEWGFWDSERRLQDSLYSPNQKGRGPRYVLAHFEAERYADFIEKLAGKRPDGEVDISRPTGASNVKSPIHDVQEAFSLLPDKLNIFDAVKMIPKPLDRFSAANRIYQNGIDAIATALTKMPPADVLGLPAQRSEFLGGQFGDRVTLTIDGQTVTNVPVPPARPALQNVAYVIPETRTSYQSLKQSIIDFQKAGGKTVDEAIAIGAAEMLAVGEHPWLVATVRLPHPTVVEWITLIPAVLTDLAVIIASYLYGLTCYFLKASDPIQMIRALSDTFEGYVDEIMKSLLKNYEPSQS